MLPPLLLASVLIGRKILQLKVNATFLYTWFYEIFLNNTFNKKKALVATFFKCYYSLGKCGRVWMCKHEAGGAGVPAGCGVLAVVMFGG